MVFRTNSISKEVRLFVHYTTEFGELAMLEEKIREGKRYIALGQVPWVTAVLVLTNAIVFIVVETTGSSEDVEHMIKMGAAYDPLILDDGQYYRLITHFFLHYGFEHLFNNMISLLVLGYVTERVMGHIRFGVLYMLSGIIAGAGSLFYDWWTGVESTASAGASGAIFGLSGALLVLVIRGNRGKSFQEVIRYLIFMALSLYSGFLDPSINHVAHLVGFLAGILLCLLLMIGRSNRGISYE